MKFKFQMGSKKHIRRHPYGCRGLYGILNSWHVSVEIFTIEILGGSLQGFLYFCSQSVTFRTTTSGQLPCSAIGSQPGAGLYCVFFDLGLRFVLFLPEYRVIATRISHLMMRAWGGVLLWEPSADEE